ncbi:MAG TPA: hypothetical protein VEK07_15175 [Polyangiaceae bacterium]|nr:hypothetical protein [Polyangiaceae bacterium]
MSDLSPETRALLDRARGGDALPRGHRRILRRRLAAAVGLAAPLTLSATAAAMWAAPGIAILARTGIVRAVAVAPSLSPVSPRRGPVAVHATRTSVPAAQATPLALVPPSAPAATSVQEVSPEPIEEPAPAPGPRSAPPSSVGAAPPAGARSMLVARPMPPPVGVVAPSPVANPTSAALSADALAAEVHLVGDAQRALRAGDPERSLALLGEYDQRFPAGALGPEAAALRVDALCAAGRASDAEAAARRLETQHPGSPLTRPLASGCAGAALR